MASASGNMRIVHSSDLSEEFAKQSERERGMGRESERGGTKCGTAEQTEAKAKAFAVNVQRVHATFSMAPPTSAQIL